LTNTYVIADLHGRYDLLLKAIALIEADAGPAGGIFISLGDFVDRGPQARQIIETLMAGPAAPNWQWIVLQGNHEEMMLRSLTNPGLLHWWMGNGGGRTLISYGYQDGIPLYPLRIPLAQLEWMASLPVTYEDDQRIFVHAGVPFDKQVDETKPEIMQWMLYPGDVEHDDADFYADEPHISGKHIVHGHHQSASHPLIKSHRTNLDSFAWYTGRAAIGVFDDSQPQPVRILEVNGPPA
jgi:serine/threonine protein phosphatase 1